MQTFEELFWKVIEEHNEAGEYVYDPEQLKCLLQPQRHKPRWRMEDVFESDGSPKKAAGLSKDAAAALQALGQNQERLAFVLVAPAFYGQFSDEISPGMLRSAFHKLGVDGFVEVALFADILTLREALEFDRNIHTEHDYMLTSCCCPMWPAMIKKQYARLVPHVPPSVSPMIAAGRTVKKLYPEAYTIFVGPCIAKKAEAKDKDVAGAIDVVLTFEETKHIFAILGVDLFAQENISREYSSHMGRIYARSGGVSLAVQKTLERLHPARRISLQAQHADGVPDCRKMLTDIMDGRAKANFFEGMGCAGGCIGGPKSLLQREDARVRVNAYGKQSRFATPLDNPYVLKLLHMLDFTTLDSLLEDKEFLVRKF